MILNYKKIPVGKAKDLTGQKFNKLTVLYRTKAEAKGAMWLCQCECGEYKVVSSSHLTSGHTKSCGCLNEKAARIKDITGQTFGRLTVVSYESSDKKGHTFWKCKCECGNEKIIRKDGLVSGIVVSCGCFQKEQIAKVGRQKALDLTNQTFGRLTALYPTEERLNSFVIWHCKCSCGQEKDVPSHYLTNGNVQSCGCLQKETQIKNGKNSLIDLTNKRFGKLKVLSLYPERGNDGHTYWLCQCDCGNQHIVRGSHLINKNIESCGCINYSIGEYNILQILKQNNIEFEKEKIFLDFVYEDTKQHPRYDFYLPKYNRIIEFDGRQHFQENSYFNSQQNIEERDQIKNKYALKNKIQIIRIPYWERDNITLEMLLGNKYLIKE